MKEENNKKKMSIRLFSTIMAVSLIAMGFIGGFVYNTMIVEDISFTEAVEKTGKSWHSLGADTGDGVDHIVNIYSYPLSEKADITSSPYECNEGDANEHGDDVDGFDTGEELAGETPYSVAHIVAVEVNFSSKAYNSSTSDWEVGLVRAYITSADLSLTAELMEEATDFSQQDGSTSAHLTFYVDNSDSGWTLGQGEKVDVTDLDIQYYG